MSYWLMKSEPEVFSIDDLARSKNGVAGWDGVRNYEARNFLKAMRIGDQAFFYHSNAEPPAVAGIIEIVREAYPDPADPGWSNVDVKFMRKFGRPVALDEIRRSPALKDMVLLRRSRLSVQPVSTAEWKTILDLARPEKAAVRAR